MFGFVVDDQDSHVWFARRKTEHTPHSGQPGLWINRGNRGGVVAGVADFLAKLAPFGFLDVFERRRNYRAWLALDTTAGRAGRCVLWTVWINGPGGRYFHVSLRSFLAWCCC